VVYGRKDGPVDPGDKSDIANARGVIPWFTRNSVAANVLMIVILLGGVFGILPRIKQEVFPQFELETVVVNIPYPGASPEEVEKGVVLTAEEAVTSLDDVEKVRSTSTEGVGVLTIELLEGSNADRALSDVESAIGRITSFPADVEEPNIFLASNRQRVLSLVVYGQKQEQTLRDFVEQVRADLLKDERITYVELGAIRPPEISVEIPRATLRRYNLTLEQVAARIRAESIEMPAGGVKTAGGEVLLRTAERKDQGSEIRDIVVLSRPDGTAVTVGDLAAVQDGFAETDETSLFNGEPAATVEVFAVGDQGPVEVSEAVHEYIEANRDKVPEGITMAVWGDASEVFADRVDLLRRNAVIGLILVLAVLGLFLELRLAFWVTLGIPISFIGALWLMPVMDVTINMISLFAFILALGMVVDDAIVVGEAAYKLRSEGYSPLRAAIGGAKEVSTPVIFAVTTTMIAFSPMLMVPGVSGKFFRNIPLVVIAVLGLSLIESLLILPAHLAHTNNRHRGGVFGWIHGQQQRFSRFVEWWVGHVYVPTLNVAVRNRGITLGVAFAMLISSCGLIAGGRVGTSFLPTIEGDQIIAKVELPFGTNIKRTEAVVERMRQTAYEVIEENGGDAIVRGVFESSGKQQFSTGGPRPADSSSATHLGELAVFLVPIDDRSITAGEFTRQWRAKLGDVVGVESLKISYQTGAGADAPINFELSHRNLDKLQTAATELARHLGTYSGVKDIDDGFAEGKEQLDFTMRREGMARGLTATELGRQIRSSFFGAEALRLQRGRDELRVYVRLPRAERESEYDLEKFLVRTPDGGEIPLDAAASVQRNRANTSIERENGRRVINVTAEIDTNVANANEVVGSAIEDFMPELEQRYGVTWAKAGQQQDQEESMSALKFGGLLAALAIAALLAVAFRSYVQPLIIMSVIPFGLLGALIGHVIMGFNLSIMSMMGLVALSGVVVNDSLILVVAVNEFREQGMTPFEAVIAGGARRFRPIILTSVTTFFGLMPMILETSVQARFLIPMAISLGFGIMFATFIMLLLVPSLYMTVEDLKLFFRRLSLTFRPPGSDVMPHADSTD